MTVSYRRLVDAVLADLPPGTFAAVVTGDSVARGKPHPEPYLTAAAMLGADPRRCVVIEDSPTGIGSGRAAGCTVIGVPHIAPLPDDGSLIVVSSLAELGAASRAAWWRGTAPASGQLVSPTARGRRLTDRPTRS